MKLPRQNGKPMFTFDELLSLLDEKTAADIRAKWENDFDVEPGLRKTLERLIELAYAKGAQDCADRLQANYVELINRAQRECATLMFNR